MNTAYAGFFFFQMQCLTWKKKEACKSIHWSMSKHLLQVKKLHVSSGHTVMCTLLKLSSSRPGFISYLYGVFHVGALARGQISYN